MSKVEDEVHARPSPRAMSCVFVGSSEVGWQVAETPSEVEHMIAENPDGFIQLILSTGGTWDGKPVRVKANVITSISPPKTPPKEEDDDE